MGPKCSEYQVWTETDHAAGAQINSTSGRAVFHITGAMQQQVDEYVDVVVCLTPESGPGHADGTVTAYQDQSFIW